VELAAYRIVQEALTNTLRHAGPARAVVRLRRTAAAVEVDVRDDGRGPSDAAPGRGLSGMRERVAVYGGELVTGPDGERGFRVRARLPLDGLPAGSLARAVPVGELT
jgi:signal transduction histidine kinase